MRIAAALLESYERQVQSVEGALKVTVTPDPHLTLPNPDALVPLALQRPHSAIWPSCLNVYNTVSMGKSSQGYLLVAKCRKICHNKAMEHLVTYLHMA